jgi:hypothetical protein
MATIARRRSKIRSLVIDVWRFLAADNGHLSATDKLIDDVTPRQGVAAIAR